MTKLKHRKHHNKKRIFTKIERYFYDWLYQNKDRFNHKPIHKETHMFYFEGITKQIYLAIDMRQMEAMLIIENKDGNIYDLYAIAYIGSLSYDSNKGYFDADRVDKVYAYYPSLKELLIAEIFEPIIKYCNETFIRENYLYLYKSRGCTWHKIGSINKDIRSIVGFDDSDPVTIGAIKTTVASTLSRSDVQYQQDQAAKAQVELNSELDKLVSPR